MAAHTAQMSQNKKIRHCQNNLLSCKQLALQNSPRLARAAMETAQESRFDAIRCVSTVQPCPWHPSSLSHSMGEGGTVGKLSSSPGIWNGSRMPFQRGLRIVQGADMPVAVGMGDLQVAHTNRQTERRPVRHHKRPQGFRSKSEAPSRFRSFLDAPGANHDSPSGLMETDDSSGGFLGALQAPRICFAFPHNVSLDEPPGGAGVRSLHT